MGSVPAKVFTIGLVGCAALALASCDGSSSSKTSGASKSARVAAAEPSTASLVSSMERLVRRASSVHVSGHLSQDGLALSVNMTVTRAGDLAGTIRQHGVPLQVIAAKDKIYIAATPAFLREVSVPASECATVCGKWIELSQGKASQLTGGLSMQNLLTPLTSGQLPGLTAAGRTTVHGQPAWLLRADDGGTVAVSSSGSPYPLRATSGGSAHQVVTFSQWNAAHPPAPPAASQLLNMNGG